MNWGRKSTVGWYIGGVLLDIVTAIFSMLQMFILGYNNSMYISFVRAFRCLIELMVRFIKIDSLMILGGILGYQFV